MGVAWAIAVAVFLDGIMFVGWSAFIDGVVAASPHAAGTFTWSGVGIWGFGERVTLVDGQVRSAVLNLSPAILLWCAVAYVVGARLWRLLPRWRR
jgi:hypothetical protein